jgi:hypothetical protein
MIITSWNDTVNGQRDSCWTSQVSYGSVPTQLQTVANFAKALTKAGIMALTYQVPLVVGSAASSNSYNIGDAAAFYFTSSAGVNGQLNCPDPDPTIFLGDGITVDLTNTHVISFVSSVMAYLGDPDGNEWVTLRKAVRIRFPG